MERISPYSVCPAVAVAILGLMMIPIASAASSDAAAPGQVDSGHKLFDANCAVCHGPDGRGSDMGKSMGAAVLTSPEVQHQTDDMLIHTILGGKSKMPPFKSMLNRDQVVNVVQYLRVLAKPTK